MTYKKLEVDYQTPLEEQLKELGITTSMDLSKIQNLYAFVEDGYIFDVEDGTKMLDKSPKECEELFKAEHRRGLTVHEGLALFRKNKKVLERHYIDLCGSRYGSVHVPHLWLNGDRPSLDWRFRGCAHSGWGAASCGSRNLAISLEDRVKVLEEKMDKISKFLII